MLQINNYKPSVFYLTPIAIFLLGIIIGSTSGCKAQPKPSPTLHQKIGQMLMVGFRGTAAPDTSTIAKLIKSETIGGVVLFDYDVPADTALRNITSPRQLAQLTAQLQSYARKPLLISVDEEGGRVSRLKQKYGFPPSQSAQQIGAINKVDSSRAAARRIAQMLTKAHINLNLAPVVDVNLNPDNPIIGSLERSYSARPQDVSRQAAIFIRQMHQEHILTTLKHFPGHGSAEDDSHKGIVDVTDTWQPKELHPYRALLDSGLTDIIMTAHIFNARLDSTYPATLSRATISGLLRDSLGYTGVVMSDDMQMGAIRKYYGFKERIRLAISAGVDILVFSNNAVFEADVARRAHTAIEALIAEENLSEQQIEASYKRIMALKKRIATETDAAL